MKEWKKKYHAMKGHDGEINGIAISPSGKLLATAGEDGAVRIWDLENSSDVPLCIFTGHRGPVHSVVFYPDGALVASGGMDHSINIWSALFHAEFYLPYLIDLQICAK